MLLRRCAQGLGLICIILITGSVILDDMALLLAGGTLFAGILGQYLIFDHQVREIVTSFEIRRSLGRNPVRRGMGLQVAARFTIQGSSRMYVEITDLLPAKTILVEGETSITARPDTEPRTYKCSYRIIPIIHGSLPFSGVSVLIRNRFFEETIQLTRDTDCGPAITVQPAGLFAVPPPDSSSGTGDSRKASIWSSMDIHSLREYCHGDDLRHVDWKISAKYDKLFVRKYTGPMSHPPLIIVDLPWRGSPYPEKEFERMISEVTGRVKHSVQAYQYVSVLFISGPNVLYLIREEKNLARCMATLREWMHPAERAVHFYRMPDRSDLRSRVRTIEYVLQNTENPEKQNFYEQLFEQYSGILQYQRPPAFSGQVTRTIAQLMMTEAHIFTLGCGDTSHIQHIVRPLQTHNIRVHVRIIDGTRAARPAGRRVQADYGVNHS